ncbi:hypothetical protein BV20DRAFT_867310 [Pilatotrama ljubarskyi]|nr:hypothetical protein BV20DRAFT_867310 [Pilatotrama ljubarskyi]
MIHLAHLRVAPPSADPRLSPSGALTVTLLSASPSAGRPCQRTETSLRYSFLLIPLRPSQLPTLNLPFSLTIREPPSPSDCFFS